MRWIILVKMCVKLKNVAKGNFSRFRKHEHILGKSRKTEIFLNTQILINISLVIINETLAKHLEGMKHHLTDSLVLHLSEYD